MKLFFHLSDFQFPLLQKRNMIAPIIMEIIKEQEVDLNTEYSNTTFSESLNHSMRCSANKTKVFEITPLFTPSLIHIQ